MGDQRDDIPLGKRNIEYPSHSERTSWIQKGAGTFISTFPFPLAKAATKAF